MATTYDPQTKKLVEYYNDAYLPQMNTDQRKIARANVNKGYKPPFDTLLADAQAQYQSDSQAIQATYKVQLQLLDPASPTYSTDRLQLTAETQRQISDARKPVVFLQAQVSYGLSSTEQGDFYRTQY
jgi:hypothetical protein